MGQPNLRSDEMSDDNKEAHEDLYGYPIGDASHHHVTELGPSGDDGPETGRGQTTPTQEGEPVPYHQFRTGLQFPDIAHELWAKARDDYASTGQYIAPNRGWILTQFRLRKQEMYAAYLRSFTVSPFPRYGEDP